MLEENSNAILILLILLCLGSLAGFVKRKSKSVCASGFIQL